MRICVLGLGYIGLPTAAMFAAQGFDVVGVDVNPRVVETLNNGRVHIQEPGLESLVQSVLQSGQLRVADTPEPSDVFVIAVPTPVVDGGPHEGRGGDVAQPPSADLSYVRAAAQALAPHLRGGNLVVLESTSPPGTTAKVVRPILEAAGLKVGDFSLAFCAERVLPGRILDELVSNDRIVGGIDPTSAERARVLYSSFVQGAILTTDATTAEMVKLMENTFRDVNIALANEFARIAETLAVDVYEAVTLANHHPRVNVLQPGPGVGGHCIAVDPWFLVSAAPDVTPLIRSARAVNDGQPDHVAELVARIVSDVDSPVVAALGLAYKADIDDLRESPSLEIVDRLEQRGCMVRPHDSLATHMPDGRRLEPNLDAILDGADACVILTDHTPYRHLQPWSLGPSRMRRKRIVDTRNSLDHAAWRAAGFAVHGLGGGSPPHQVLSELPAAG